jgi:hypothetical protein
VETKTYNISRRLQETLPCTRVWYPDSEGNLNNGAPETFYVRALQQTLRGRQGDEKFLEFLSHLVPPVVDFGDGNYITKTVGDKPFQVNSNIQRKITGRIGNCVVREDMRGPMQFELSFRRPAKTTPYILSSSSKSHRFRVHVKL